LESLHRLRSLLVILLSFSTAGVAQTSILPLRDVRAGMTGTGYTVFSGTQVEPFSVEVLGVLENAGPKQAIILARLSGGPLAHTGVLQGMSGSPVYIDGKLAGAVALAFSLSKDPIAGIRPIEEMFRSNPLPPRRIANARCLVEFCPPARGSKETTADFRWGEAKLAEVATPVSFSGFTASTLEHFGGQLRTLGLEPRQGMSGGGPGGALPRGTRADLQPGSMISVQLVSGDMSIGADGTVTHIEGNRVYAFGHRFLSAGQVDLPFASAEVLTLLPNLSTSFKISSARKLLGTITEDDSTAVRGELGRQARLIPVRIQVKSNGKETGYAMEMIRDAALTPFLLQMMTFSALEATERLIGGLAFKVEQTVAFKSAKPYISRNIFSGEFNTAMIAAQSGAIPVSYVMQSGFPALDIDRIDLSIEAFPEKRQLTVEDVIPLRRTVRPGETVPLQIVFASQGERVTRTVSYKVPAGAAAGPLQFTITDGPTANLLELRQQVLIPPQTANDVTAILEELRVWRAEATYSTQGRDLPSPPPSVAGLLARSQGGTGFPSYTANTDELVVELDGRMISGNKTVTVEVKE